MPTTPKQRRPNARVGWQKKFIANLRKTANVRQACLATPVHRRTAYRARERDADFAAQWDDALEEACDKLEEEAWNLALHGTTRPIFYKGKECGEVVQHDSGMIKYLLGANRPAKYRENYSVEHTGPSGGPILVEDVSKLTAEERQARIDELLERRRRAGVASPVGSG